MKRTLFSVLPFAAAIAITSLPASALDIKGFTTANDANCWLNPACSLPRGGDSDVMTVYAPDGSIFQQIFAFGGEETNNVYYFDPNLVQFDPTMIGHYTKLLEPDGVTWSDGFGIGTVNGVSGFGFISGIYTEGPLPATIVDQTYMEQPDILNPVPEPGYDNPYLTIPYDATQYLSANMRAAGYKADFRSDLPEPATLGLLGLGLAGLGFARRRKP